MNSSSSRKVAHSISLLVVLGILADGTAYAQQMIGSCAVRQLSALLV